MNDLLAFLWTLALLFGKQLQLLGLKLVMETLHLNIEF